MIRDPQHAMWQAFIGVIIALVALSMNVSGLAAKAVKAPDAIDPTLPPRVIGAYVLPEAERQDLLARGMPTETLDALTTVHILAGSNSLHVAGPLHPQARLIPRDRPYAFAVHEHEVVFVFGEDGSAARATALRATIREATGTFRVTLVRREPTADPVGRGRKPWIRGPLTDASIDVTKLEAVVDALRHGWYGDIHSLMIVQDGQVVLEEYFRGSSRAHAHQMRSASKSVGSVLLGIAIDRGYVTEAHKIVDVFKDYTIQEMNPDKAAMTVRDVLTMQSGLAWKQWGYRWPEQDGYRMVKSHDHIQYVLDRPMAHPPGQVFNYSDGVSNLIGGVLDATTGMSARTFADAFLFEPLGITSAAWWGSDKQGHLAMGWGLKLTTPDMMRFGLLILNDGKWGERQIVSSAYLHRALTMYAEVVSSESSYGYQWWGFPVILRGQLSYIYSAAGLGGQRIWIVPRLQAVIVVTAWERSRPWQTLRELLTRQLLPALEGKSETSEVTKSILRPTGKSDLDLSAITLLSPTPIHDLKRIIGKWEGVLTTRPVRSIPLTVNIHANGHFDLTTVDNSFTFTGTIWVTDGAGRWKSSSGDYGAVTLHEGEGKRFLKAIYFNRESVAVLRPEL